jgi:hypothetical protein
MCTISNNQLHSIAWREKIKEHIPTRKQLKSPEVLIGIPLTTTITVLTICCWQLSKKLITAHKNLKEYIGILAYFTPDFSEFNLQQTISDIEVPHDVYLIHEDTIQTLRKEYEKIYLCLDGMTEDIMHKEETEALQLYCTIHLKNNNWNHTIQTNTANFVVITFLKEKMKYKYCHAASSECDKLTEHYLRKLQFIKT